MKIKSYRLLFRIFSFLSDRTNGFPLFARYKLMLGTLILGLSTTSCLKSPSLEEPEVSNCYLPSPTEIPEEPKEPEDESEITCYLVGPIGEPNVPDENTPSEDE